MLLTSMIGRMRAWRQWNRWDNAQAVALEILQLVEVYQLEEKQQLWALETLATIAYRTGKREEADQYTRQYKRLIDQQPETSPGLQTTRMHAIHLACEDWSRSTRDYKEKLQQSEPLPAPEVLATLAELLVTTGEAREVVETTCERAVTLAETSGDRKSLLIALRARGRMYMEQEDWKLAENDLRQALHRCEVLDLPWERGNTLYYLGMFYRRRSQVPKEEATNSRSADLGRARYHFEQALGFFESLHAVSGAERTRLALMQDTTIRI